MDLEQLSPKDGDVILVRGAVDPAGTAEAIRAMLASRGVNQSVAIVVLPAHLRLEVVDEETMRKHGWVPAERPVETAA